MKKAFILIFLGLLFSNNSYAETYFFKNCKLSNAVTGSYIINLEKIKIIKKTNILLFKISLFNTFICYYF